MIFVLQILQLSLVCRVYFPMLPTHPTKILLLCILHLYYTLLYYITIVVQRSVFIALNC